VPRFNRNPAWWFIPASSMAAITSRKAEALEHRLKPNPASHETDDKPDTV
jgi:hypothetical protein